MPGRMRTPSRAAGAVATSVGFCAAAGLTALLALVIIGPAESELTPDARVSAAGVRPDRVQDPAVLPSTSAPRDQCRDPRESLRPDGPLPAPQQIPAGSTMARIVERGWLIAGVNQNAYRVGYRDPSSGEPVGFEIEIVREIARALFGNPDKVKYKSVSAPDRIPTVQRGEVDLVVRTWTMTCADWREVAFSTEYYGANQRLLVKRGSGVAEIEDLNGKKVCAADRSTSLTNIPVANPRAVAVSTRDVIDCLIMLQQGQIDAIATSDVLLVALAAQDPNTVVVGRGLLAQPYGVAINRDQPDLVRFVNGVLERMRTDGTWTAAHQRWLGVLGAPPPPPQARYLS